MRLPFKSFKNFCPQVACEPYITDNIGQCGMKVERIKRRLFSPATHMSGNKEMCSLRCIDGACLSVAPLEEKHGGIKNGISRPADFQLYC